MRFGTAYLNLNPDHIRTKADSLAKQIEALRRRVPFDAIAVRGVSGYSVGFPVSYITGIPLIVIRKGTERSHGQSIECDYHTDVKRYMILDDFIETGSTVEEILHKIDRVSNTEDRCRSSVDFSPECVGVILYQENKDDLFIERFGKKIPIYKLL
jgi:orotate phosphoribosyltransferase